jgi:PAS domain-containing protein
VFFGISALGCWAHLRVDSLRLSPDCPRVPRSDGCRPEPTSGGHGTLGGVSVTELLRLAPFSLGTITVLLAAAGLIFGHSYGRYGDDAAIGFLLRWRFVFAIALVIPAPVAMLVSFGQGSVPAWLRPSVAAVLVGAGIVATIAVVGYLLVSVSRPGAFLSSVGRRVTVRRVNRYALAMRWRQAGEFDSDLASRKYAWLGHDFTFSVGEHAESRRLQRARWTVVAKRMSARKVLLRFYRNDPSEMLFDAAAAGLKNGNMRTWRKALEVLGRRLQDPALEPAAASVVVDNALALEEAAHRQGSEDCKVKLAAALGAVGQVSLANDAAEVLALGIASLAERRLTEHRPVLAAVAALNDVASSNAVPAVRAIGKLGQHMTLVAPPAAVYGFDGERTEHPTRALFAVLVDLAERANRVSDAALNDTVIDATSMIVRKLPGQQDQETMDTLGFAAMRAGESAARHYGAGDSWHGVHDAVDALLGVAEAVRSLEDHDAPRSSDDWIAEAIARIGCQAVQNTSSIGIVVASRGGRSDMAALVAERLLRLPRRSVERALIELLVRQHNSEIPHAQREQFIGICQRFSSDLLGLAKILGSTSPAGPSEAPEE